MVEFVVFDADNIESACQVVLLITKDWFDPTKIYFSMKKKGITENSGFWFETDRLLSQISKQISLTEAELLNIFTEKCQEIDLRIKSYHRARCLNVEKYKEVGILPLSERTIRLFFELLSNVKVDLPLTIDHYEKIIETIIDKDQWKRRVARGMGPYLFLSYNAASKADNACLINGPESWWYCIDELINYCREHFRSYALPNRSEMMKVLSGYLKPVIFHCIIPFSILPDKRDYAFFILRSFFNSLDPEENSWGDEPLKLRGTPVSPEFIINIEEISDDFIK